MGRAFAGQCFESDQQLIEKALNTLSMDSTGVYKISSASVSGNNLVATLEYRSSTSNAINTRSVTVPLKTCEPRYSDMPVEGVLFICAMFFAAVFGLSHGRDFAA